MECWEVLAEEWLASIFPKGLLFFIYLWVGLQQPKFAFQRLCTLTAKTQHHGAWALWPAISQLAAWPKAAESLGFLTRILITVLPGMLKMNEMPCEMCHMLHKRKPCIALKQNY
jgi:hypothetical protein